MLSSRRKIVCLLRGENSFMKIFDNFYFFYRDWKSIFRYNGGLAAFFRCFHGTLKLEKGYRNHKLKFTPKVDCVTFSVVPKLTALWSVFIERAITTHPLRICIGDCSGGLHGFNFNSPIKVIPLFNYEHGEKIDLFLKKICTADYVIVSDDDIFWLDDVPWNWALSQLENDPGIAVVSLVPRPQISSVLKGKTEQPMGSYCLVLRRKIWLQENISFKIVYPPASEGYDWFYDTADYANLVLLKRGYKITVAPPELQTHFATLYGISKWILRIQKKSGYIQKSISNDPIRKRTALRIILAARELAKLVAGYYPHKPQPQLVPHYLLDRAEKICEQLLQRQEMDNIHSEVSLQLEKIKEKLASISQTSP